MKIEIYTDGACNQQTKTGGWSFLILENGTLTHSHSKKEIETTNNQCEMRAIINACDYLDIYKEPIDVTVYSDSAYIVNGFLENWMGKWVVNGWKNALNEPVLNKELWESLMHFHKKYSITFTHIKRCSNEHAKKVDEMAKKSKT